MRAADPADPRGRRRRSRRWPACARRRACSRGAPRAWSPCGERGCAARRCWRSPPSTCARAGAPGALRRCAWQRAAAAGARRRRAARAAAAASSTKATRRWQRRAVRRTSMRTLRASTACRRRRVAGAAEPDRALRRAATPARHGRASSRPSCACARLGGSFEHAASPSATPQRCASIRTSPRCRATPGWPATGAWREIGIKSYPQRGSGTDFKQLADYRPGDSIRDIDWKATLRHGRPIVREYQDERDQRVVFLLDCGRRMRADEGSGARRRQPLRRRARRADAAAPTSR